MAKKGWVRHRVVPPPPEPALVMGPVYGIRGWGGATRDGELRPLANWFHQQMRWDPAAPASCAWANVWLPRPRRGDPVMVPSNPCPPQCSSRFRTEGCGYYAYHPELIQEIYGQRPAVRDHRFERAAAVSTLGRCYVYGIVTVEGKVIEHECGYRAQWLRPVALFTFDSAAARALPRNPSFDGIPVFITQGADRWRQAIMTRLLRYYDEHCVT